MLDAVAAVAEDAAADAVVGFGRGGLLGAGRPGGGYVSVDWSRGSGTVRPIGGGGGVVIGSFGGIMHENLRYVQLWDRRHARVAAFLDCAAEAT